MKKYIVGILEIFATLAIVAVICVGAVFAAKAIGRSDTEKDEVNLCLEEIVPQYEWENYIYTYQPAKICAQDASRQQGYYYTITVFAPHEDGKLHRYEWICRVRYLEKGETDVDADLVRDDVCEDY